MTYEQNEPDPIHAFPLVESGTVDDITHELESDPDYWQKLWQEFVQEQPVLREFIENYAHTRRRPEDPAVEQHMIKTALFVHDALKRQTQKPTSPATDIRDV